jgi:hypothetical protein
MEKHYVDHWKNPLNIYARNGSSRFAQLANNFSREEVEANGTHVMTYPERQFVTNSKYWSGTSD